jgi:hypothetical protein
MHEPAAPPSRAQPQAGPIGTGATVNVAQRKTTAHTQGRWDGLLCSVLVLLAILASHPFVEMGIIDDFSYVKTAWVFARTGHFVYNGWATAMLGWQIVWAAPFIKLLGYTFLATRVSTLVLGVLCVLLTHAVLKHCGLDRWHAVFGTLTLGLSPLFVPMTVTFMTDISGLFAILLSLYCCLRALESASDRGVLLWLVAAAVVGVIGGTARQIAWLPALVLVPSAAWILRRRRGVVLTTIVLWLLSVASIALGMRWFAHQPLSVPEPLLERALTLRSFRELAGAMFAAFACILLVSLPAMATSLPLIRRFQARTLAILVGTSLIATWVCRLITFHLAPRGFMPWTGDILSKVGVLDVPNAWWLGVSPTTFDFSGRVVASVVVFAVTAVFCFAVYRAPNHQSAATPRISWPGLLQLLAPFVVAYVILLAPRGFWAEILDRYLLPLLVISILLLLRLHQERIAPKLPLVSWIALAIYAAFAVMGTHDWVESHRARLDAVSRLESAGVPVQAIEAGYEFDGMTQIDLTGAVYDPRLRYPAGIDTGHDRADHLPDGCDDVFNEHTPAIHPRYFLSYQVVLCLTESPFGAIEYRAWLPPFRRQMMILQKR